MVNTIMMMGVHRSGNHGILNWLIGNLDGRIIHINALNHEDLTPELYFKNSKKRDSTRKIHDSSGFEYYERDWTNFHHADWLILSLESFNVRSMREQISDFTKKTNCKSIILLRDPLNNAASMFRSRRNHGYTIEEAKSSVGVVLQRWDQHANEMIREDSFWTCRILFNRWFLDVKYRDRIMSDLGYKNTDSGFGDISGHGRSSFDRNDDAAGLDLEGRYLSLVSEEGFLPSLAGEGVDLELWKKVCELHSYELGDRYQEFLSKFPRV